MKLTKAIIFLILIITANYSFAQTDIDSAKKNQENERRMDIGVTLNPNFSLPVEFRIGEFFNSQNVTPLFSYQIGIALRSYFARDTTLFISLGFGYLTNRWKIQNIPITINIIDENGNIISANLRLADSYFSNRYTFLSSSFGKKFLFKENWGIITDAGLQGGHLLYSSNTLKDETITYDERIYRNKEITSKNVLTFIASVGVLYNISRKTTIGIGFQYGYDLNAAQLVNNDNRQFQNLQASFNFTYKLKS